MTNTRANPGPHEEGREVPGLNLTDVEFNQDWMQKLRHWPVLGKIASELAGLLEAWKDELARIQEASRPRAGGLTDFTRESIRLKLEEAFGASLGDRVIRIVAGDDDRVTPAGDSFPHAAVMTQNEVILNESVFSSQPGGGSGRPAPSGTLTKILLGMVQPEERWSEAWVTAGVHAALVHERNFPVVTRMRNFFSITRRVLRLREEDIEKCILNCLTLYFFREHLPDARDPLILRPEVLLDFFIQPHKREFVNQVYNAAQEYHDRNGSLDIFHRATEAAYAAALHLKQGADCISALLFKGIPHERAQRLVKELSNGNIPRGSIADGMMRLLDAGAEAASFSLQPMTLQPDAALRPSYEVKTMISFFAVHIRNLAKLHSCKVGDLFALCLAGSITDAIALSEHHEEDRKNRETHIKAFFGTMAAILGAEDFHEALYDILAAVTSPDKCDEMLTAVTEERGTRTQAARFVDETAPELARHIGEWCSKRKRRAAAVVVKNLSEALYIAGLPKNERMSLGYEGDIFVVGDIKSDSSILSKEEQIRKTWKRFLRFCADDKWIQRRAASHFNPERFLESLIERPRTARVDEWMQENGLPATQSSDAVMSAAPWLHCRAFGGEFTEAVLDGLSLHALALDLIRWAIVVPKGLNADLEGLSKLVSSFFRGKEVPDWDRSFENICYSMTRNGVLCLVHNKFIMMLEGQPGRDIQVSEVQVIQAPHGDRSISAPVPGWLPHAYYKLKIGQEPDFLDARFERSFEWRDNLRRLLESIGHSLYVCVEFSPRLWEELKSQFSSLESFQPLSLPGASVQFPLTLSNMRRGTRLTVRDAVAALSLRTGIPVEVLAGLSWPIVRKVGDRPGEMGLDEPVSDGDRFRLSSEIRRSEWSPTLNAPSFPLQAVDLLLKDGSPEEDPGRKNVERVFCSGAPASGFNWRSELELRLALLDFALIRSLANQTGVKEALEIVEKAGQKPGVNHELVMEELHEFLRYLDDKLRPVYLLAERGESAFIADMRTFKNARYVKTAITLDARGNVEIETDESVQGSLASILEMIAAARAGGLPDIRSAEGTPNPDGGTKLRITWKDASLAEGDLNFARRLLIRRRGGGPHPAGRALRIKTNVRDRPEGLLHFLRFLDEWNFNIMSFEVQEGDSPDSFTVLSDRSMESASTREISDRLNADLDSREPRISLPDRVKVSTTKPIDPPIRDGAKITIRRRSKR